MKKYIFAIFFGCAFFVSTGTMGYNFGDLMSETASMSADEAQKSKEKKEKKKKDTSNNFDNQSLRYN